MQERAAHQVSEAGDASTSQPGPRAAAALHMPDAGSGSASALEPRPPSHPRGGARKARRSSFIDFFRGGTAQQEEESVTEPQPQRAVRASGPSLDFSNYMPSSGLFGEVEQASGDMGCGAAHPKPRPPKARRASLLDLFTRSAPPEGYDGGGEGGESTMAGGVGSDRNPGGLTTSKSATGMASQRASKARRSSFIDFFRRDTAGGEVSGAGATTPGRRSRRSMRRASVGSLPNTPSGKVRRGSMIDMFGAQGRKVSAVVVCM